MPMYKIFTPRRQTIHVLVSIPAAQTERFIKSVLTYCADLAISVKVDFIYQHDDCCDYELVISGLFVPYTLCFDLGLYVQKHFK